MIADFLLCVITLMVGVGYPLFKSIEALNMSKHLDDEEQLGLLKSWLAYWVVYNIFNLFDDWFTRTKLNQRFPSYYLLKLQFLVWSFHPATRGANLMVDYLQLFLPESLVDSAAAQLCCLRPANSSLHRKCCLRQCLWQCSADSSLLSGGEM